MIVAVPTRQNFQFLAYYKLHCVKGIWMHHIEYFITHYCTHFLPTIAQDMWMLSIENTIYINFY